MTKTFLSVAATMLVAVVATGLAVAAPIARPSGQTVFAQNCVACHQAAGQGIPGAFPALARDKFVVGDPAKVVQVLLNGRGGMPTFRDSLNDAEIAAVVSHIRSAWGNRAPPVSAQSVAALRGGAQGKAQRPIPGH